MKKLILLPFIIVFFMQKSRAQSFEVHTEDTLMVQEDAFELSISHASVKNISNQPLRTIVVREIITLANEHSNYFCWGINCYAPTTTQSPDTLLLEPQTLNNSFKGYIDALGHDGISEVRYSFINASNLSDKASYKVKYIFGTTGIPTQEPGQPTQVPASYDPNTQTIKVNVSSGKIGIWNMIGQKVDLNWKYDGAGMVADASSLKPGYYFLFGEGDNRLWSARVIVSAR